MGTCGSPFKWRDEKEEGGEMASPAREGHSRVHHPILVPSDGCHFRSKLLSLSPAGMKGLSSG